MDKDVNQIKKMVNYGNSVPKASRHIRWNYEKSDKNYMDNFLTNFHFVIVDKRDTFNEEILRTIYNSILSVNSVLEQEPLVKGVVRDSEFKYLFASCYALAPKDSLGLSKFNRPIIFDKQLVNKKVLNLSDYVKRIYE